MMHRGRAGAENISKSWWNRQILGVEVPGTVVGARGCRAWRERIEGKRREREGSGLRTQDSGLRTQGGRGVEFRGALMRWR